MYFAFDPRNPENRKIVDLDLAPRNERGEVEAWSEFVILRPKDPTRSAELAVIDIVNRGGITTFTFNLGQNPSARPETAEAYGDALLMKRGVTIVALGWQWDVAPSDNALNFVAPQVGSLSRPITGLVRSDITVDTMTSSLPLAHSLAPTIGYQVADTSDPCIISHDPVTGKRAGLRDNLRGSSATKVFYVDGGHEYWGRAASLTHTTPDGTRDVGFLPTERRYVISSAQHSSPAVWPLPESALIPGSNAYRGNPLNQRLALRALMSALIDWVKIGTTPPPSLYPTLASRNLVRAADQRFPAIPNLPLARIPYLPYRLDFGPRWPQGLIDLEPPRVGDPYPVLVSRVDSIGNDLGGIQSIELLAPLATYYPWQLRSGMLAGNDRLASFRGTFIPLPRTEAARRSTGDPRPSIESLYGDRTRFLQRVDAGLSSLVAQRFLLPEDVSAARNRMTDAWARYGLQDQ